MTSHDSLPGAVTVVCRDTETGNALLAPTSPLVSSVSDVGAVGTLHQTAGSTCKFNIIMCTTIKLSLCHRSTVAPSATTVTDKAKMDSEVRVAFGVLSLQLWVTETVVTWCACPPPSICL